MGEHSGKISLSYYANLSQEGSEIFDQYLTQKKKGLTESLADMIKHMEKTYPSGRPSTKRPCECGKHV